MRREKQKFERDAATSTRRENRIHHRLRAAAELERTWIGGASADGSAEVLHLQDVVIDARPAFANPARGSFQKKLGLIVDTCVERRC